MFDGARPAADLPPIAQPGRPKVSVMVITYNHERYIAQALDSVLMQETSFDFEINVIEDCSTDGTANIIREYAAKYPDIVKPYLNSKNIGYKISQRNFTRGFRTLNGEYIAILEGDDFWSSPLKLQKQVDFLDNNSDFVICAHNTIKMYDNGSKEPHRFLYYGEQAHGTIEDVISLRMFFHTTGVLYRNVFNGVPPRHYISPWSCDIFVMISHAEFGKIHHMDEDLAVYRAHTGGRFSTMSTLQGWFFNIGGLQRYNAWLNYRFAKPFSKSIIKYCDIVLTETGHNGIPRLKWGQRLKYQFIRLRYQVALWVLDFPVRLHRSALLTRREMGQMQVRATLRRESTGGNLTQTGDIRSIPNVLSSMFRRVALAVVRRFAPMELSPVRLPSIVSFGPEFAPQGKPFNIQSDGSSALWMRVSEPLPPQTIIVFGGVSVRTSVSECLVTALIPTGLTQKAGLIPVWLESEAGGCIQVSDPVYFELMNEHSGVPTVESYGPVETPHGKPFNVQPDGHSWMWIKVASAPPAATIVVFGGIDLSTAIDGRVIAAMVPPELVEHPRVVPVQLALDGATGRLLSPSFILNVV